LLFTFQIFILFKNFLHFLISTGILAVPMVRRQRMGMRRKTSPSRGVEMEMRRKLRSGDREQESTPRPRPAPLSPLEITFGFQKLALNSLLLKLP
jgi:hypothetical protein